MSHGPQGWLLSLAILSLALSAQSSQAHLSHENHVKTAIFLSPKFVLRPGSVVNKLYYDIDFPQGHIAIKGFNAEVVDEAGNPVPLHETYLHHWVLERYYQREIPKDSNYSGFQQSDVILVRNSGICDRALFQYYGLGSETQKTDTHVPDPYGIEVGDPAEIPAGFEEKWRLNIQDRLGCTECRCDLYNVTNDEQGRPLTPDYIGGLRCCYDETQCRVRKGFVSAKRSLYMRYTVKWAAWDSCIVPVKIYIFDVTDTWKRSDGSRNLSMGHNCLGLKNVRKGYAKKKVVATDLVEYVVEACDTGVASKGCFDTKRVNLSLPTGGDVVYGVAHQHTGGIGSAFMERYPVSLRSLIRSETIIVDGRVICSSIPTYGKGNKAGNEAGYIVGMSTCYPRPGSVKISDGAQRHTGVMGLFYILVAESSQKPSCMLQE
ncbi:hypothetical protein RJ639_007867 [Escallonia herrerae]|uniref:Stress up-regulated Nod 19 n=1 Tax=Escallonia herrerae TaxID=1293975 RepID=A0AA88W258_9ASTE|nr:hypothetical protein RJ639_007867 [Escallonia herrerae]